MKRNSIQITIPTPCHEQWGSMGATERGAFCSSCQKEVIDFSAMTDKEVIEYLSRNKTECGRFRRDQVDTRLSMGLVRNGFLKWKAFTLAALSLVTFKISFAFRHTPSTIQASGLNTMDTAVSVASQTIRILGLVRDSISCRGLPTAKITIQELPIPIPIDSNKRKPDGPLEENVYLDDREDTSPEDNNGAVLKWGHTDSSGVFSFQMDSSINERPLILTVSLYGYLSKQFLIDPKQSNQSYTIDLEPMFKEVFNFAMGRIRTYPPKK